MHIHIYTYIFSCVDIELSRTNCQKLIGDILKSSMPRKEYKTITIKLKTFLKFAKNVKEAQKKDPKITNSSFLEYLLSLQSDT